MFPLQGLRTPSKGCYMLDFLLKNNLLNNSQHGFLPSRSCCSALLSFMNYATNSVDNNKPVDVVYLDFTKAFDSVPHDHLIAKLTHIGFRGVVLNLIKSFLTDRQQKVNIAESCSQYISVPSGVPQGSVLGPLLFLIYIDDIDTGISSNIIKFADDIKLFSSLNRADHSSFDGTDNLFDWPLQRDLDLISDWCNSWLLKLNPDKCSCLHIGRSNPHIKYNIKDSLIPPSDSVVDLGVVLTKDLKPSTHCLNPLKTCLLYTSPSPRDLSTSRMPSSA